MRFAISFLDRLKGLARFAPTKKTLGRLSFVAGFVACTAAAFWYGRQAAPQAVATSPTSHLRNRSADLGTAALPAGDYGKRMVAQIYDSIPITREDLGEYLIARFGAERVEFLVNRKIVEKECTAKGIFVSDAEVEDQLDADIEGFGKLLTREEFVNNILKRFNKTLYEWKEDVIRPKLALSKLCRSMVVVEEADIRKAYEAKFGPRVEVRLICFQKDNRGVYKIYEEIKDSEEKFSHQARNQFIQHLAMNGGKVPPIHKNFADPDMERVAFSLKEGEVSETIKLKDETTIVMKCDKILPADTTNTYGEVRLQLERELIDQKLAQKIPEVFNDLRKKANPKIYLRPSDPPAAEASARKEVDIPPAK